MKVAFLTALTSRSAGGLYFTITEFTKALHRKGIDVSVIGFDDSNSTEDRIGFGNIPVIPYNRVNIPILNTFGYSTDLMRILEDLQPDIIHLQGLWMYHSWAALRYKKKHPQTKIVIEPHGMLDDWAIKNSKWKKKIVGHLFEYENLKKAHCIHALCKSEYESIRKFGLKNPVANLPNGINLPEPFIRNRKSKKTLLFISRIHPKKGIELLVDAIYIVSKKSPALLSEWNVRIAGWNQINHQEYLQQKVNEFGLNKFISFIGPVFGEAKREELINADAFILPSYSEGLPMSILEAWSYKLPVLMTDYCNLPEGFENNAAIRIQTDANDIAQKLIELFEMNEIELGTLGNNGFQLVATKFTWSAIADNTIKLYDYLLGGRFNKPDFLLD